EIFGMPRQQIPTYGMAQRYCIFDLWAERLPEFFRGAVEYLQGLGFKVILAHPERMRAVQDDEHLVDEFTRMGLLLQGNLQCFSDPPDSMTRRTAEMLLLEDRYYLLGSDAHRPDTLPKRLEGLDRVAALAGGDVLDRLTITHPRELL